MYPFKFVFQIPVVPVGAQRDASCLRPPIGGGHVCMIALEDLGFFARYAFDHRASVSGKELEVASDWVGWDDLVATFTKVTGQKRSEEHTSELQSSGESRMPSSA